MNKHESILPSCFRSRSLQYPQNHTSINIRASEKTTTQQVILANIEMKFTKNELAFETVQCR